MLRKLPLLVVLLGAGAAGPLCAQDPPAPAAATAADRPTQVQIRRAQGPITVDADLSDAGWQGASRVDSFVETNPGDNIPARVRNVAYLAYDDRYFYAAFEFDDPDLGSLRAPFGDRDVVPGYTDYGGVILDTRNDRQSAVLLLVNPRNIQYDAQTNDASGEDPSLDLYWDSATRITDRGWILEMRVPFSSLRYTPSDPQTWGILLYRNWPREFRTQMFNTRLPRGSNCFICHRSDLVGLEGLPAGRHYVLAPYATGKAVERPSGGLGTPLDDRDSEWDAGLDAKITLNADTAIDATINPDFSQIESDVAQIGVNERFALFFPERRPFFLEQLDLFQTPVQAVYTRTVTSPRWGVRATGELLDATYTLLVAEDRGGGSVILPGPEFSQLAFQDFSSSVLIGRARRDFGRSFASFVVTGRDVDSGEGGGHNVVLGPDFLWRPGNSDTVIGQLLVSDSQTPERPDLAAEWDGRSLSSHALHLAWNRNTPTWDWLLQYRDVGDEFRADAGFLPQVGIRDSVAELGHSWYPETGILRGVRPFVRARLTEDRDGEVLLRRYFPALELSGFWNGRASAEYRFDEVRAGELLFDREQLAWSVQVNPSRRIALLGLDGVIGEEVDFTNLRPGRGTSLTYRAAFQPTDHLNLRFDGSRQWLEVRRTPGAGGRERLFTAEVARLLATYTFTARAFLRLIGQQTEVDRDVTLYGITVPGREEDFTGSALFAYKLNWQTVLFLGYGDERLLDRFGDLQPAGRELFFKVSYAFQR